VEASEYDTFLIWNPCDLRGGPESVEYGEMAATARLLRQELTHADADGEAGPVSGVRTLDAIHVARPPRRRR
jgi:hypothetical protein